MKITLRGVSGVILVQTRDCPKRIIKRSRNIGRLVKYPQEKFFKKTLMVLRMGNMLLPL